MKMWNWSGTRSCSWWETSSVCENRDWEKKIKALNAPCVGCAALGRFTYRQTVAVKHPNVSMTTQMSNTSVHFGLNPVWTTLTVWGCESRRIHLQPLVEKTCFSVSYGGPEGTNKKGFWCGIVWEFLLYSTSTLVWTTSFPMSTKEVSTARKTFLAQIL